MRVSGVRVGVESGVSPRSEVRVRGIYSILRDKGVHTSFGRYRMTLNPKP